MQENNYLQELKKFISENHRKNSIRETVPVQLYPPSGYLPDTQVPQALSLGSRSGLGASPDCCSMFLPSRLAAVENNLTFAKT